MGIFEYIAVLTSIIGLSISPLLRGVAGVIHHPDMSSIYRIHLLWVAL